MFHSQRALDVLEAHGATVDREATVGEDPGLGGGRGRWRRCRGRSSLGGRSPEFDLPLDGEHAYLTSDGCATFVREADGAVRPSAKHDVVRRGPRRRRPGLTSRPPPPSSPPRTCRRSRVCCTSSTPACGASRKHSIVVSIKDATEAKPLIRMAEAVAGGSAELAARPTFSVILCTWCRRSTRSASAWSSPSSWPRPASR